MGENVVISSELLWRSALVTALVDAPLVLVLAWRVNAGLFRQLKWYLVGAAALVYAGLWGVVGSLVYWEAVYRAVFPGWMRWLLPLIQGVLFGGLALGSWRLSLLDGKRPVVWFCLLGGLVSLGGHSIGFSRGLMRVPMLAQASPASALAFGVFEFIFYWCLITGLAAAGRWLGQRLR
jgi:hypothetical protein